MTFSLTKAVAQNRSVGRSSSPLPRLLSAISALCGVAALAVARYEMSATGLAWGVALIIAAVLIPQTLMVANQWERAVVLRLGKLNAIRGPGLFGIIPFVDEVTTWIDQRIQTTEFNTEEALTRDTVPVNVNAIIF